jgi:hypothetical protein
MINREYGTIPLVHYVPEDEKDAARELQRQCAMLAHYTRQFAAAVSLFENASAWANQALTTFYEDASFAHKPQPERESMHSQGEMFAGWSQIAARDGALTIFHFGKTVDAMHGTIKRIPSLFATTNLDAVNPLFRQHFPRFEAIRHAVGHEAEFINSPRKRAKHSTDQPFKNAMIDAPEETFISGMLEGNIFTSTFEGKPLSYEVSRKTLANLDAVKNAVYDAFEPIVSGPPPIAPARSR